MNTDDQLRHLESRIDGLAHRLTHAENELEHKISDARNDAERATDQLRNDLNSLEHKVDYS